MVKIKTVNSRTLTAEYALLKAYVEHYDGNIVDFGSVKFAVNGKVHVVKVYAGVAKKKIKLSKPGVYKCKAKFYSKYYSSKTSISKITVKRPVYKVGKYVFVLSDKQYKLVKYVKNHRHTKNIKTYYPFLVNTNKNYIYKKPIYEYKQVTKTKWVYKNVLIGESYIYDEVTDNNYYSDQYYWNHGWQWYGSFSTHNSDYSYTQDYNKFKKKVTYTTTEKVKVGETRTKLPVKVLFRTYCTVSNYEWTTFPTVQFVVAPTKNPEDWIFLTKKWEFYP